MEELIDKLYNTYLILLDNLSQGYPFEYKYLADTWELIQLIDFMSNGHPSETELLWIADRYENVKVTLSDVGFNNNF